MDMDLDKPATGRHDDPAFFTHRSPDLFARHLQRWDGVSTTISSFMLRICLHVVCNWRAQPSSWRARGQRRSGVLHAAARSVRFRPEPYTRSNLRQGFRHSLQARVVDDVGQVGPRKGGVGPVLPDDGRQGPLQIYRTALTRDRVADAQRSTSTMVSVYSRSTTARRRTPRGRRLQVLVWGPSVMVHWQKGWQQHQSGPTDCRPDGHC